MVKWVNQATASALEIATGIRKQNDADAAKEKTPEEKALADLKQQLDFADTQKKLAALNTPAKSRRSRARQRAGSVEAGSRSCRQPGEVARPHGNARRTSRGPCGRDRDIAAPQGEGRPRSRYPRGSITCLAKGARSGGQPFPHLASLRQPARNPLKSSPGSARTRNRKSVNGAGRRSARPSSACFRERGSMPARKPWSNSSKALPVWARIAWNIWARRCAI